jgi:hypothetical protein
MISILNKIDDNVDDKIKIIELLSNFIETKEEQDNFIINFNKSNDSDLSFDTLSISIKNHIINGTQKTIFSIICNELFKIISDENKILFVNNYIKNDITDTLFINILPLTPYNTRSKILSNKLFMKEEKELLQDFFEKNIYDTLEEEIKLKHTKYSINFDSHYEFYKLDEKEYTKVLCYHNLIDDWTFNNFRFDNYSFLDGFNDEVKKCIISKINADINHNSEGSIFEKYGEITSLNNLIDISFFMENMPEFLRQSDRDYHQEHIDVMLKYLKDINYDENKLIYSKYKMNISFTIEN